jgi:hypothetical protein
MAALDPTNTYRTVIHYNDGLKPHVFMIRSDTEEAANAAPMGFSALIAAHAALFPLNWAIESAEVYRVHEHYSTAVPITLTHGTSEVAVTGFTEPRFYSLIGRSSGGRRVRSYIYGIIIGAQDNNYRFTPGDNTYLDAFRVDWLNFLFDLPSCAIDGNLVVWKSYLNTGFNAYWQRKVRG